jgi:hypothetical protein
MRYPRSFRHIAAALVLLASLAAAPARAADAPPSEKGTILLTVLLKHDQSKTLDEINRELDGWKGSASSLRGAAARPPR